MCCETQYLYNESYSAVDKCNYKSLVNRVNDHMLYTVINQLLL